MPISYYHDTYRPFGDLDFPRSLRTCFDPYCHEYQQYPMEKKLLDIGYLHINGYDIHGAISALLKRRPDISSYCIRSAILAMESKLTGTDVLWHQNDLFTELDLFLFELRRRYVCTFNYCPHYIQYRRFDKDIDRRANGWTEIGHYSGKIYDPKAEYYFPGDREYIEEYNARHPRKKPIRVNAHVLPEPWYGNPLTAKVIIIAPPQVFDAATHKEGNLLLEGRADAYTGLCDLIRHTLGLWSDGLFDTVESEREGVYYDDYYCSPGYRHQVGKLREIIEANGLDPEKVSESVAVVNEFPYLLEEPTKLPNDFLPPSQHFLRQLLTARIHGSNDTRIPAFIIPRMPRIGHPYFERVMDGIWGGTWGQANRQPMRNLPGILKSL